MAKSVAIIGAGVSGLTCGILFAERGYHAQIFAAETGRRTTSAAAAAIWYPYDAEPAGKVIPWALESYEIFRELSRDSRTGVSMIELRNFSRAGDIQIPTWADSLGARPLVMSNVGETSLGIARGVFGSGFAMSVPLIDTTFYLDYLAQRFTGAGGQINDNVRFARLEEVDRKFSLIINCSGIGARSLVPDSDVEPHRGQVAIVPRLDLSYAVVTDDAPLMYVIPRTNDCVFGGTNDISDNCAPDPIATSRIVTECSRVLNIEQPRIVAECVGLRPFRKSGVRLEGGRLLDGRATIHNYGHGGAGFTLSWGCARQVLRLASGNKFAGDPPATTT